MRIAAGHRKRPEIGEGGRDRTRADAALETAALPLSYTPVSEGPAGTRGRRVLAGPAPAGSANTRRAQTDGQEMVPGGGVEPPAT